jgi:hypothetical protein
MTETTPQSDWTENVTADEEKAMVDGVIAMLERQTYLREVRAREHRERALRRQMKRSLPESVDEPTDKGLLP